MLVPKSVLRRLEALEHRRSAVSKCGRCEDSCPRREGCPEWFFRDFLGRLERQRQMESLPESRAMADRKRLQASEVRRTDSDAVKSECSALQQLS